MTDTAKCSLCGEPMPEGEQMFKFHGYSGPCPKEPLPKKKPETVVAYALWSNEMYIREEGQVGVLHGRLFESPEATKAFYEVSEKHALKNGVLVKVTVETLT